MKEKLALSSINELLIFAANEGVVYPELVLTSQDAATLQSV